MSPSPTLLRVYHLSMMGALALLSLGSNIEPEENLPAAVARLRELGRLRRLSNVYQNPAVGPSPQADYLNACALLETNLPSEELRLQLRQIEAALGRIRTADKFAPRTIDIDIVLDDAAPRAGRATPPPDPELFTRAHLAIPAAELVPDLRHPVTREPLSLLAERLRASAHLIPRPDVTARIREVAPPDDTPLS